METDLIVPFSSSSFHSLMHVFPYSFLPLLEALRVLANWHERLRFESEVIKRKSPCRHDDCDNHVTTYEFSESIQRS